ncbi:MAG TPA: hypothetical protein VKA44_01950, partial [Gemmatimonadota bacterium]|nr:hypothetical protein [Gemmatimonadota bacterium]
MRTSKGADMADRSGDLLLVRHPEGEAGRYLYNETFVHWLEMERPALRGRIRLHRTGGEAPSLDGVRAVLFWLADPLREVYPACYREAAALAARARERGIRTLNHPDALSNSISSRLARLWEDADIPTPSSRRFADLAAFRAALDGLSFPALVRAERAHGRAAMHTCRTREEAAALGPEELA